MKKSIHKRRTFPRKKRKREKSEAKRQVLEKRTANTYCLLIDMALGVARSFYFYISIWPNSCSNRICKWLSFIPLWRWKQQKSMCGESKLDKICASYPSCHIKGCVKKVIHLAPTCRNNLQSVLETVRLGETISVHSHPIPIG